MPLSAENAKYLAAGAAIGAGLSISVLCLTRQQQRRDREGVADGGDGGDGGSASTRSAMSPTDFLSWGDAMLRWIVRYRTEDALTRRVVSGVAPNYLIDALPRRAPEQGESWMKIMRDLDTHIVPGLTHWEASNRFFGYFKPHASYPAVMGELLCAGLNVMGFDWIASPACTELEMVTLDWLAHVLNLPERFLSRGRGGGVIQGSAGEANIVVLLAAVVRATEQAKAKAKAKAGAGAAAAGGSGAAGIAAPGLARERMTVYASDQTHAVCQKACMVLGVRFHSVPTTAADGHALRGSALAQAIATDRKAGLVPIAVVATTGTTSSCAFDKVAEVADVCEAAGLWLHIDAAYGGAYACLPELAHHFQGLERADSLVVNAHKKLLCPFDLAALYLADRRPVLDALSLQPEYLRNAASASGAVTDFEHLQLPLGRRFRALKLWFVLRRFGAEGIRSHLRQSVELRRVFERLLQAEGVAEDGSTRFELCAPPSLSLVCFRWRWPRASAPHPKDADAKEEDDEDEEELNEAQIALKEAVNATGECFIIHTKLGSKRVLRFACGGLEQNADDVQRAWAVIRREAARLEASGSTDSTA